eukprot:CAMPEP_0114564676 /NCGR_PEP_ID=MMETSP0114-20121206/13866_1 /TAXON_ID=31324 /ORGANISM="Goniomonas sp, Strain m" /LENGTH=94 /DNA_ID=CAMNT_0001750797 /DNA_START=224 /DNA_END=508 /DNA_ORIENTATION=-
MTASKRHGLGLGRLGSTMLDNEDVIEDDTDVRTWWSDYTRTVGAWVLDNDSLMPDNKGMLTKLDTSTHVTGVGRFLFPLRISARFMTQSSDVLA